MTQYNILSIKLSNLQLSKLNSGTKYGVEVTLKISSNVAGNSNGEDCFLHKLLLTNIQVSRLCKFLQMVYQLILNYQKFNCMNRTIRRTFRETLRTITKRWVAFNEKCT